MRPTAREFVHTLRYGVVYSPLRKVLFGMHDERVTSCHLPTPLIVNGRIFTLLVSDSQTFWRLSEGSCST